MSEVTKRFEKILRRVNLRWGLFLPILIGFIAGRVLNAFNPDFFRTDPTANLVYYVVMVLGVTVLAIHYKTEGKLSSVALAGVNVFYHIALALLIIFIDPYPTPFYFQVIAVLIAVDLVYGERWQKVSITYFGLVIYASYFRNTATITAEGLALAGLYTIGAATVAILVSKYRRISDEERDLLDSTTKQSAYERQRLLSLINNMGEAVAATDKQGKILLYNAAVLDLLDTNVSLEGQQINKILHLINKYDKPVDVMDLLAKSPTGITNTSLRHQYSTDDAINMYINIAPVKLGFKEDLDSGYIVIMRDITKEKSLEEERDEFISVVSHELRTPVAIAEGNISNAQYAVSKKLDKKALQGALQEAHDQVVFLSNMINDLATLSRAERTDTKLEIVDINPGELLHEIAKDYSPDAEAKKLKLTTSAAKNTKPIKSSELYLREILQNFITNSIKYTKTGSIVVHVRTNTKDEAVFSVADTGIGLSKSDQKRVFEKFFRSEDYRTRESNGTGLGLYVTAKLAHRLKATIELESKLNKGSTFTITVPSLKD